MKLIIVLSTACIMLSCNNKPVDEKPDDKPAADNPLHCYIYINNKDTVVLKTISVGSNVTGALVYNFYEKDKNKGTIQGHMNGILLIADYTFNSEGVSSVRQVVFKKTEKGFTEGYGNIIFKDGKTSFKNLDSLNFENSILLTEIECEK